MHRWLKITLLRAAAAILVLGFIYSLFVVTPSHRAKGVIIDQLQLKSKDADKLQTAINYLKSLPDINGLPTQQVGIFKDYADQAQKLSDDLSKLAVQTKQPGDILGYSNTDLIKDTNKLLDESVQQRLLDRSSGDLARAKSLVNYNAAVFKALTNVLEYNPSEDTKNFKMGTDDTTKRLALARQGLAKSLGQLSDLGSKFSGTNINELTGYIQSIQAARDNLAKNGDTKSWVEAVSSAQQNITTSCQKYWKDQSIKEANLLKSDLVSMEKLHNRWYQLKQKYNLK